MSTTKIKICGLFRLQDAQAVNRAAPDYAGFVFFAKSRRNVTPEQAQVLRAALNPDIPAVGVFVNAPAAFISELLTAGIIQIAQLHGGESPADIAALRTAAPALPIWQAFKIYTAADVACAAASPADTVLLDGGAGEGKPFDWSLIEHFPRPYVLAGGLTPESIPRAIARLHPFAVDLSSGVETDGVKDASKIMAAATAARRA